MKTMNNFKEMFDKDYFENGVGTGKSLYSNYRWMPEISFPIAHDIVLSLGITKEDKIIDFGCAKGFLVKAFTLMGYDAYGVDISKYAIENAEPEIKDRVFLKGKNSVKEKYDFGICKDVLEHCLNTKNLEQILEQMNELANKWFVAIPLGNGRKYFIPAYDLDPSHFIKQPKEWWLKKFSENFKVEKYSESAGQIKRKWVEQDPRGNLFAILTLKH
jgi:SAM-dependent methyltransferase